VRDNRETKAESRLAPSSARPCPHPSFATVIAAIGDYDWRYDRGGDIVVVRVFQQGLQCPYLRTWQWTLLLVC
jgi:hypothetical protein